MLDRESARFDDSFLQERIQPFLGGKPIFLPFSSRWSEERFRHIIDLFDLLLTSPEDLLSLWLRESFGGLDLGLVQRRPGLGVDASGQPEKEYKDYFHYNPLLRDMFSERMAGRFPQEELRYIIPLLNVLQSLYVECREASWALYRTLKSMGVPLTSVHGNMSPDIGILRVLRYYPVGQEYLAEPHTDASCWTFCLYEDAPGLECCIHGIWTPVGYVPGKMMVMPADKVQLATGGALTTGELRDDNTRKVISGGSIQAVSHRVVNDRSQQRNRVARHSVIFFPHHW